MARRVRAGWIVAVVAMIIAAGVGYVGWWLTVPSDCAYMSPTPQAWGTDGLHPDVRGGCPVHPGDVITGSARPVPGEVRFEVLRDGAPITVDVPLGPPDFGAALREGWSIAIFTLSMFALACYAFARRRTDPAARALLVCAAGLLSSSAATMLGLPVSAAHTGWRWVFLLDVGVVYTIGWAGLLAFALAFPSPWPGRCALVAVPFVLLVLAAVVAPAPLGSDGWAGQVMLVQSVITVLTMATALVIKTVQYRAAGTDRVARQQLRWVGAGGTVAVTLVLAGWFVPSLFTGEPLLPFGWIGLPGLAAVAGLGVALLRYRLFDLDAIINRTIVYATLSVTIVTLYLGVVAFAASVLRTGGGSPAAVIGAAVVAVAVNPLRTALQRGVTKLMYGDRDDPYTALSRLGQRLAAIASPGDVLPAAALDVAHALRVPFVAIDLIVGGELVRAAMAGAQPQGTELTDAPLVQSGEVIGKLTVAARAPGERPSSADRRLLADLAGQVSAAARVVTLNLDLQRSRERLVLTREEERRALRRTLHDEIGPTIAGFALRAETIRRLLGDTGRSDTGRSDTGRSDTGRSDTESRAVTELGSLRRDATAAATDLRHLAYDLRPPALDERGLMRALAEHGQRLAPLHVTVEAADDLGSLPAAVEVAAFRIAVEAMTNAARHAGAQHCTVQLAGAEPGMLLVTIRDDGSGLPDGFRAGVGIVAMRERAVELGGTCVLERCAGGDRDSGTLVTATLPIGDRR